MISDGLPPYGSDGYVEISSFPEKPMGTPAIDLARASPALRQIVKQAARTGEVLLTVEGEAVAKIVPLRPALDVRRPGFARGMIHMADDFDEMPDDFKDLV
jgi:antitoxin (DNA-binding transcriptional repressor) of toxin-antitoxin stability system